MVVQSCGLFGILMSLRLIMIFIPLLFSNNIRFFSGSMEDFAARIIILAGALFSIRKGAEIINGILANNSGMVSSRAMDGYGEAGTTIMKGVAAAQFGVSAGIGVGKWAAGKMFGGGSDNDSDDPTLIDKQNDLPKNNSSIGTVSSSVGSSAGSDMPINQSNLAGTSNSGVPSSASAQVSNDKGSDLPVNVSHDSKSESNSEQSESNKAIPDSVRNNI